MPDKEPSPIDDDLDVILYRLITPEIADRYAELKRETKAALEEARTRHKRALGWLRKRNARPEQFLELEADYTQRVAQHRADFKRKLDALFDELLGEGGEDAPPDPPGGTDPPTPPGEQGGPG